MRRSSRQLFTGVIVFFILVSLLPADTLTDRVDKLFASWDKPDSPGCALGVIQDGQFLYERGYGMANLEYDLPITSESVFRIGSTSKQFTAMCLLLLEEEGKLSLDDDIRKHLPEMPEYESPITIRHLLHHTSGIRDYLTLMSLAGERDDDFYVDGEVVDLLARQKELNFKPGEEHLYSNSGYFLLSVIVKRVTGQSMHAYAQEKIFAPLEMSQTHFHDDHTMIVENRASGYSPRRGGGFSISMTTLDMIGDGGIFTCVEDLLRWDQNFYHNQLGKARQELIARMTTPGTLNSGEKLDYALGLTVSDYRGLKMISHGGAFVGFRAEMIRFPEQRFSVIILANLSAINPSKLARQVADVYLAGILSETPSSAEDNPEFISLPESQLKEKEGIYYNRLEDRAWKVYFQEETLYVDTFSFRFRLRPIGQMLFHSENSPYDMLVEFVKPSGGKPPMMRVKREGAETQIFEAVHPERADLSQLKEYEGQYFSPELQVSYEIFLKKGQLFLRHQNPFKDYPRLPFIHIFKDKFRASSLGIDFFRNGKNQVVSLTMNAGRVRNIRFFKK
jgi:CubicO group peptidase (beta-lactamase class C family)